MAAGDGGGAANLDEWALQHINIGWVRKLVEAFDGDASGFVTIKEANDFTSSRPLDWRWVLGNLTWWNSFTPTIVSHTG